MASRGHQGTGERSHCPAARGQDSGIPVLCCSQDSEAARSQRLAKHQPWAPGATSGRARRAGPRVRSPQGPWTGSPQAQVLASVPAGPRGLPGRVPHPHHQPLPTVTWKAEASAATASLLALLEGKHLDPRKYQNLPQIPDPARRGRRQPPGGEDGPQLCKLCCWAGGGATGPSGAGRWAQLSPGCSRTAPRGVLVLSTSEHLCFKDSRRALSSRGTC